MKLQKYRNQWIAAAIVGVVIGCVADWSDWVMHPTPLTSFAQMDLFGFTMTGMCLFVIGAFAVGLLTQRSGRSGLVISAVYASAAAVCIAAYAGPIRQCEIDSPAAGVSLRECAPYAGGTLILYVVLFVVAGMAVSLLTREAIRLITRVLHI